MDTLFGFTGGTGGFGSFGGGTGSIGFGSVPVCETALRGADANASRAASGRMYSLIVLVICSSQRDVR